MEAEIYFPRGLTQPTEQLLILPKYNQQDEMLHCFIYFCKLLYMFRVVPPPIIRSTKPYLQHLVLVKPLLLPAASGR